MLKSMLSVECNITLVQLIKQAPAFCSHKKVIRQKLELHLLTITLVPQISVCLTRKDTVEHVLRTNVNFQDFAEEMGNTVDAE